MFIYTLTLMTQLFGNLQQTGNTPRLRCINFNFWGLFNPRWTLLFGRLGPLLRPNITLGSPFKIGSRRPTVWLSVVGQIVAFARYASKPRNQRIIFSSILASPFEFRNSSKIGLGFKVFTLGIGRILISRIGGLCWQKGQLRNVRCWQLYPCSPCGSFGTSAILGSFAISIPSLL
jgi:hypothetical protein